MESDNRILRAVMVSAVVLLSFVGAPPSGTPTFFRVPSPDMDLEGREDDPGARLEYETMRLRDPQTGRIPDNIREKELAFAAGIPKRSEALAKSDAGSSVLSTSWNQRGPFNVGGRTRALAIDQTNGSLMLAGGVSGGMWRSTNAGSSWTQATTPAQLHSVTCIIQDTRSGQTSTWYYGTGEYLGNSSSGGGGAYYQGDGIFKSTDNGASWSVIAATSTGQPQQWSNQFDYIWGLAIDPSNTSQSVVYAAVPGYILKSTNGGSSWSTAINATSPVYSYMTDVRVTSTGIAYATISNGSSSAGIWRWNGSSWVSITPSDMPASVRRIVIAVAPSNENIVYFLAETPGAGYQTTYAGRNEAHSFWQYTYLSGDGSGTGGSWSNRSSNLPNFGQPVGNFASQGSYDLVIKVKPDDANTVFFGGTNLYRTADGLATASSVWIGGYATANNVSEYSNQHPDQHSLAFSPTNPAVLYSGHDGGLSVTSNDVASTVGWSSLNRGYYTTQFYTVAIDHGTSGNSVVIGGMQDNGSWFTNSSLATASWISELGGDGTYCAVADGRTSYYASSQNATIYRLVLDAGGGLQDYARVDPTGGTGYLFVSPFALDPSNNTIMYLAGGTSLWRNSNLTQIPTYNASQSTANNTTSVNWTNLSSSNVGTISAIGVSTASPSNRVYYGTNAGAVYRLDNASTASNTSTQVDVWSGKGLPSGAFVSCIAVDPTNGNKALLIFSNYNVLSIFYTSNGGLDWANVGGSLEQNPTTGAGTGPSVRWGAILPYGGNTFYYVGTSTGLYSTTTLNGTSTAWAQEGPSTIGNVVVDMIDTRTADGMVVVGTHGQGVFSGTATPNAVVEPETLPVSTALMQNYPNPFNPSTTIRFSLAGSEYVTLKVYDVTGREVATLVDGNRTAGVHEVAFEPKNLASGMYIYRITAGRYVETRKLVYLK